MPKLRKACRWPSPWKAFLDVEKNCNTYSLQIWLKTEINQNWFSSTRLRLPF